MRTERNRMAGFSMPEVMLALLLTTVLILFTATVLHRFEIVRRAATHVLSENGKARQLDAIMRRIVYRAGFRGCVTQSAGFPTAIEIIPPKSEPVAVKAHSGTDVLRVAYAQGPGWRVRLPVANGRRLSWKGEKAPVSGGDWLWLGSCVPGHTGIVAQMASGSYLRHPWRHELSGIVWAYPLRSEVWTIRSTNRKLLDGSRVHGLYRTTDKQSATEVLSQVTDLHYELNQASDGLFQLHWRAQIQASGGENGQGLQTQGAAFTRTLTQGSP